MIDQKRWYNVLEKFPKLIDQIFPHSLGKSKIFYVRKKNSALKQFEKKKRTV